MPRLTPATSPSSRPARSQRVGRLPWLAAALLVFALAAVGVSASDARAATSSATFAGPASAPNGQDPPGDTTVPADPMPRTGDPEPVDEPNDDPVNELLDELLDEPADEPAPGLPTGPPPGYTDDQFRRFVNVVQACGFDSGWVCDSVYSLTGNETLAETSQWVYDVPLRVGVIFLIAFGFNRIVRRGVGQLATRASAKSAAGREADPGAIRRDDLRVNTATSAIGGAATIVIFVIAGLISLGELGITLGPLLAGAGIAGIALGFGAQHLVRDVLAGIFVVFEDHYGVGDIIDAGKAAGVVEEVSLRITKVRDIHGTLWFIPNGIIEGVGNRTQLWARAIIDFDIDYRADHERAGEIIKATADRVWQDDHAPVRILEEPALWGVESLGDSSVVIRLAVKCAPAEQWTLARLLRGKVKKALDAEGIEIPFPQHTVWVHGVPEGADEATRARAAGAAGAVGAVAGPGDEPPAG